MKLSIITINYNNASGLQKTIESVTSQTSREFEYLVIDGGSTDGSLDVIKKFSRVIGPDEGAGFKLCSWLSLAGEITGAFVSEPDHGIYHAMNKGARLARGEVLQFLNSGDVLAEPDVTEKMLQNMPECTILFGNMQLNRNGKDVKWLDNKMVSPTFLDLYTGSINHSSAYIRKTLLSNYGYYDESLKIVSDWKFYLVTIGLNSEKIIHRDITVTKFDIGGISNKNKELLKSERRQVLEELVPKNILADYDANFQLIRQGARLNKYIITRFLFWFIERVIAKIEKLIFYIKESCKASRFT